MPRNATKRYKDHTSNDELNTPRNAKVTWTLEFMDEMGVPHFKTDVFRYYGLLRHTGNCIEKTLREAKKKEKELNGESDTYPEVDVPKDELVIIEYDMTRWLYNLTEHWETRDR